MADTILCLNAGSSSVKFKLYEAQGDDLALRFGGQLDGIGVEPHIKATGADGSTLVDRDLAVEEAPDVSTAMPALLQWLADTLEGELPVAIGHRVVLGGTRFAAPTLIDGDVLEHLKTLAPLAPLHLPPEIEPIEVIAAHQPDLPQVAVFDTGFHRGHSEVLERLPVPQALHDEGVRRYGFHGISYEYIAQRLPAVAPDIADGRVVVAHLGSGCSMCALDNGRSVESTMGFSALGGLPMGTRPGQLDPGVLLYLLQVKGMSGQELERLLYKECGLKGISGISNDVRALLASDAPAARLALDYFTLYCARAVADLATVLGGLDALVFTAGVGEHGDAVRAAICERLAWLGVKLDPAANSQHGPRISAADSAVACYVVPTDEELMIARHALALVRSARA